MRQRHTKVLSPAPLRAVVVVICLAKTLSAQMTRGTISGIISDSTGARIQNALIRIVDMRTNNSRETRSNDLGIYRIAAVVPGEYDLEISAEGFATRRFQSLLLQSAHELVVNQTLSPKRETESIEVQAAPLSPGLPDLSIATSRYFGREALADSPLLSVSRDPQLLALFMPTVGRAPAFSGISAGGQRSRNQDFLIDGTDNNDLSTTGAMLQILPEELSELQIQFPSFSAEFGHSTGTQISALTRSGTNSFHGSVWDYYRANWLEPLALVDKRAGFRDSPRFLSNQAGSSLGGPIRRDRTFFFGVIEADRDREGANTRSASTVLIPTRVGYSQLASIPLAPGQSAASRQNTLQALSFLPEVYNQIGDAGPVISRAINSVPVEFQNVRIPFASPSDSWHALARGDQSIGSAGSFSYRYLLDRRSQGNATDNLQFAHLFAAAGKLTNQSHAASLTYALNPDWIMENRFAYVRNNLNFLENDPTSPTVQILGAFTIGGLANFPQGRVSNIFQGQSLLSHQSGRHLIKFGVDLRRNRLYNLAAFDQKGTWTFNNFADFLNSQPSRLRHLLTDSTYDARQTSQAYFVQDDIHLTRGLNLNAGLRYEISGAPFGYFGTRDPVLNAVGIPGPTRRDTNNLAPRLGISYLPETHSGWAHRLLGDNATVIRGGYSLNYDVIFSNVLTVTAANYPRALKYDIFPPDSFNLFPQLLPLPEQLPDFDPLRYPFANVPEDLQNPTAHHWVLAVQRQLGSRQFLEFGYAGNRAYHLLRQGERNPGLLTDSQAATVIAGGSIPGVQARRLQPGWASRATLESTAISKYHALFARHHQSILPGLISDVNFTWSGTFSDNDEALAVGEIGLSSPQLPQNVFDYHSEWSRSVFDRPLRVSTLFTYELPKSLSALTRSSLVRQAVSGWKFSGSIEWQSGQPFTIVTGVDSGGSGIPVAWRPDLNLSGHLDRDPSTGDLRTFNAVDLFITPRLPAGNPLANSMAGGGNLGRNTLRGPSFSLWNLNVSKNIPLSEILRVQLRADFLNVLNHRNFGNPIASLNSPVFGSNTSDPGARSVLLSARISF